MFFFHGLAPPAGFADAIEGDVLLQQLLSSTGHGVRIQAEKLGQFLIAAVPHFERFQAGVQAALLFIQQIVEQNNGGFQFVRGDFQKRGVDEGREGLHAAAPEQLALAAGGIKRGVCATSGVHKAVLGASCIQIVPRDIPSCVNTVSTGAAKVFPVSVDALCRARAGRVNDCVCGA